MGSARFVGTLDEGAEVALLESLGVGDEEVGAEFEF